MEENKRNSKAAAILAVLAFAGGVCHLVRGIDYVTGVYALLLGVSLILPYDKAARTRLGLAVAFAGVAVVRILRTPELNVVRIVPELAVIVGVALVFVNLRRPESLRRTALAFALLVPIADIFVSATFLLVDNMNGSGGSAAVFAGIVPLATRLVCDAMIAAASFVALALDSEGKLTCGEAKPDPRATYDFIDDPYHEANIPFESSRDSEEDK